MEVFLTGLLFGSAAGYMGATKSEIIICFLLGAIVNLLVQINRKIR